MTDLATAHRGVRVRVQELVIEHRAASDTVIPASDWANESTKESTKESTGLARPDLLVVTPFTPRLAALVE